MRNHNDKSIIIFGKCSEDQRLLPVVREYYMSSLHREQPYNAVYVKSTLMKGYESNKQAKTRVIFFMFLIKASLQSSIVGGKLMHWCDKSMSYYVQKGPNVMAAFLRMCLN